MLEQIAKINPKERKAIFLEAAGIKKINSAMIEKDFWVCWILNRLFSDPELTSLLRFKGGTSLSKVFNVLERFSEDIDLILDWNVIRNGRELIQPSNTKQDLMNKAINTDAQVYISTILKNKIEQVVGDVCIVTSDDEDKNVIKVKYPKGIDNDYLLPFIKLEIGPLAAWTPNKNYPIKPYIDCIKGLSFMGITVPTIVAERTFWEKVTILHREHFRDEKKKHPERYSRHYYDLYMMGKSPILDSALDKIELLFAVVNFKKTFYPCSWARYDLAEPKTIQLLPLEYNANYLENDYKKMRAMIYGEYPDWNEILEYLKELEDKIHNL